MAKLRQTAAESEDIVKRALEQIKPTLEKKRLCATTVRTRIYLLRQVHDDLSTIPSPGMLKKELKKIGDDLEKDAAQSSRRADRTLGRWSSKRVYRETGRRRFLMNLIG